MKAVICTRWGPPEVLEYREVAKPVPKDNEVLIRIHAATVFAGDCELRGLKFSFGMRLLMRLGFGFRGPRKKILGQELAGTIERTGKDVRSFKEGDEVFGLSGFGFGTYAEYKCLPENGIIALKPANMPFEEAAAVPTGGLEALYYLRKANVGKGQKVLINGAGGSIGTFGIQLAKHYGAEVTVVDSADKLDMLISTGADHVIDYVKEDFTQNGQVYDVIFDVVGKSSFAHSEASLGPGGYFLMANPMTRESRRGRRGAKKSGKKVIFKTGEEKAENLITLKELCEEGVLKTVIDRRYPLERTADAHRYVDSGRKKGNVVLTIHDAKKK